jgi:hypothetical protein
MPCAARVGGAGSGLFIAPVISGPLGVSLAARAQAGGISMQESSAIAGGGKLSDPGHVSDLQ